MTDGNQTRSDSKQNVRILYFAALRELTGIPEEQMPWTEALDTVDAVLKAATRRYPQLAKHVHRLRIARNESFAHPTDPVRPGDVIALIPPVAGG